MTQSNVFPANLIWRTLGSHVRMTFGSFYVVLLIYMLSFSITNAQRDDEISQNIIEDGGTNGTAFNIDSNIYTKNDSFVQTSTIKFNIITSKPGVLVSSITVPLNGLNSSNNQDKSLESTGKDELSEGPKIVAYESNSIISQTTSKPIISIPLLWSSQVPSDAPIVLDQSTDKSLELKENEESSLAHSTTPQPHLKDEDIKMPSQEDVTVLNATELQPQVTIKPNISSYSVMDSNKYKNKLPISPSLVNSISNFQTSIGEITQIEDTTNNEFFNEPSSEHFASDLSSSTARTFEQSSTIANNENILGSVSPSSQYVNDVIRNNTSDSSVFSVSESTDSSVSENSQTMLKSETNIPVTNVISDISSNEPMSSSVSSYMEIPDSTIPEMLTSDIPNSSYDENSIDSTIDNNFENLGLDPEIISVSEESIEVFVHVNIPQPPAITPEQVNKTTSVFQLNVEYEGPACAPTNCTVNCVVIDSFQRPGLANRSGFSTGIFTVTVSDLSPFTNYSCVAYATNEGAPENLNVNEMDGVVTIEWTIDDVPGILQKFIVSALFISCEATKCTNNPSSINYTVEPDKRSYSTDQLDHFSVYNITVQAFTNAGAGKTSVPFTYKTHPAESESVQNLNAQFDRDDLHNDWNVVLTWELPNITNGILETDPYATSVATQTQITFHQALFDDSGGGINWYEVIVAHSGNQQEPTHGLYEDVGSIPEFPSWSYAPHGRPYRASPKYWKPIFYGSEIAVGMIVGIMFAIIILGFLAILFIMYRKGTLVWPPKLLSGVPQVTVRPQPILLKKFPAYCAQLLDTPNRLKNEFQLLATLSADLVAVNTVRFGEQPENRRKNRYCNILPYLVDGDPTSHYINASFIKGYSVDIEYIACQGPLEDTCQDFWRMVYQHDVHVIAMVTNLVEQNKLKCHQYYPNLQESLVFGDMTIRCTKEMNFPIHTARTLVLIKGDRKRTISHLHFREWPDFGVPQSTDFMLQFCQTMRHHAMAAEIGLILVHCSAGVGRTGTLIALDILLQHISENKKVDIFGTVFKLREQRINMVQTEGQYTYIYRCIKEAVQDPTIVSQGTTTNNSLEPIYENVGTTLNSIPYEYEKLPKVSAKSSSSEMEKSIVLHLLQPKLIGEDV
ncbi:hypothetical protein C0J52_02540 [Blattella germanica]|nr:hypothetical protein C0J52_02540 [Blattella germanica]